MNLVCVGQEKNIKDAVELYKKKVNKANTKNADPTK